MALGQQAGASRACSPMVPEEHIPDECLQSDFKQ
jgi:hypothetical protein